MSIVKKRNPLRRVTAFISALAMAASNLAATSAQAATFTLDVVDQNGAPVNGFRWLVEEDNTHPVTPGAQVSDSLSLDFHNSHAPVVAKGTDADPLPDLDPAKRYFVSVTPYSGHSIGGAPLAFPAEGDANVTVVANANRLRGYRPPG